MGFGTTYNAADPYGGSPEQRLASAVAQISYQTKGFQNQYNKQRTALGKQYKAAIPKFKSQYAQRGIFDSGIRKEARRDLETRRTDQLGLYDEALQQALYDLRLQTLGAYGQYSGGEFEAALTDAQLRSQLAAQIKGATQ
jgi:hypothetical protein